MYMRISFIEPVKFLLIENMYIYSSMKTQNKLVIYFKYLQYFILKYKYIINV